MSISSESLTHTKSRNWISSVVVILLMLINFAAMGLVGLMTFVMAGAEVKMDYKPWMLSVHGLFTLGFLLLIVALGCFLALMTRKMSIVVASMSAGSILVTLLSGLIWIFRPDGLTMTGDPNVPKLKDWPGILMIWTQKPKLIPMTIVVPIMWVIALAIAVMAWMKDHHMVRKMLPLAE